MIPESLGNTKLVLRPGVVCDKCNNYFSRKVEGPLLESQQVHYLRFEQAVSNKRGRVPAAHGSVVGTPVVVERDPSRRLPSVMKSPDPNIMQRLQAHRRTCLTFHDESPRCADERTWSRFLGKAALEAMAHRLQEYPDGLEYLATEPQLDPLRNYVRFNDGPTWPISTRPIYCRDQPWEGLRGTEQRVWECDFLVTPESAWYFVLALFGQELAINVGHREILGYRLWLWRHAHGSPLYGGDDIGRHKALTPPQSHPSGGRRLLIMYDPGVQLE